MKMEESVAIIGISMKYKKPILIVLFILGLPFLAWGYKTKLDGERFSLSAQESCLFFEEEIGTFLMFEDLNFIASDDYRSQYYSKFAINYSDEYGIEKDVACYFETNEHDIVAYLRFGTPKSQILKNDKFYVFWISSSGANVDFRKVYWKRPD